MASLVWLFASAILLTQARAFRLTRSRTGAFYPVGPGKSDLGHSKLRIFM